MENLNFWIKKLDPYFEELDEIPLFRGEKFSFSDFADSLKKELSLEKLEITSPNSLWLKQDAIKSLLGGNINQLCLTFTPLLGNTYFMIGKEDLAALTNFFLSIDEKSNFPSKVLQDGFYRHLILIALEQLKKQKSFEGLSPKIVEDAEIKSEFAFCFNINIKAQKNIDVNATVAITPDFRRSWNEFFFTKKSVNAELLKSMIELPIEVVAGEVLLTKQELESIEEGDFIALEKNPSDLLKAKLVLKINGSPIFHAKAEKNVIHILDYANYYEESEIMEENPDTDIPEEEISSSEQNEELLSLERDSAKQTDLASSSLKDMPVKVTVELAKISMTLEKLTSLSPGNILELSSSIDSPVRLTINGKKIGMAELTQIGETLGIRILQIG